MLIQKKIMSAVICNVISLLLISTVKAHSTAEVSIDAVTVLLPHNIQTHQKQFKVTYPLKAGQKRS